MKETQHSLSPWWVSLITTSPPEDAKALIQGLRKLHTEKIEKLQAKIDQLDLLQDRIELQEISDDELCARR